MDVKFYDTFEEMQEDLDKRIDVANSNLTEEQKSISYGDYWMALYPHLDNLVVFGHIMTEEEMLKSEKEAGATKSEVAYAKRIMRSSYQRGFRFGTAYSIIEPRGELGDTHIADMVKITKEEFELAESYNWNNNLFRNEEWWLNIGHRMGVI